MMLRVFAACAATLLAPLPAAAAPAATTGLPPDLAAAVKGYDEAQVHGDRAALERWLADDYTLVNSAAQRETKAQLIADYTAPGYRLDPFVVREPVERVWGDGAVMAGIADLKGVDGGKPFAVTLHFADIWAKRNGKWQVIFTQVTRPKAG